MPKKKSATKKRPPKRRVTGGDRKTAKRIRRPKSIEDYFNSAGQLKNSRHELWCQAWVQTFNEEEAARAGGFKDPEERKYQIRYDVMSREECQLRIQQIVAKRSEDMCLTPDWVVQRMLDVFRESMEERPIAAGKDGGIIGYEPRDLRTARETLHALGVNLGMFQKQKAPERPTHFIFHYGDIPKLEQQNEPEKAPKATVRQVIQGQAKRLN